MAYGNKIHYGESYMLHAIDRRKSNAYQQYFKNRPKDGRRVCSEDEITSTIFGPQEFLQTEDVFRFWVKILNVSKCSQILGTQIPDRVQFSFWPSRIDQASGRRIEPDATISFFWKDGKEVILLIEFKWNSPLSGDDQLYRQWKGFLSETERQHAIHLFIAKEIGAGIGALNDNRFQNVWSTPDGNKLALVPWMQIRSTLKVFSAEDSALGRWARLTDNFLQRVGIKRFAGFDHLTKRPDLNSPVPSPIFWRPYSFTHLVPPQGHIPVNHDQPIFFTGQ